MLHEQTGNAADVLLWQGFELCKTYQEIASASGQIRRAAWRLVHHASVANRAGLEQPDSRERKGRG